MGETRHQVLVLFQLLVSFQLMVSSPLGVLASPDEIESLPDAVREYAPGTSPGDIDPGDLPGDEHNMNSQEDESARKESEDIESEFIEKYNRTLFGNSDVHSGGDNTQKATTKFYHALDSIARFGQVPVKHPYPFDGTTTTTTTTPAMTTTTTATTTTTSPTTTLPTTTAPPGSPEEQQNEPRAIVNVSKEGPSGVSYIIHPDNLPAPKFEPLEGARRRNNTRKPAPNWHFSNLVHICCSSTTENSPSNEEGGSVNSSDTKPLDVDNTRPEQVDTIKLSEVANTTNSSDTITPKESSIVNTTNRLVADNTTKHPANISHFNEADDSSSEQSNAFSFGTEPSLVASSERPNTTSISNSNQVVTTATANTTSVPAINTEVIITSSIDQSSNATVDKKIDRIHGSEFEHEVLVTEDLPSLKQIRKDEEDGSGRSEDPLEVPIDIDVEDAEPTSSPVIEFLLELEKNGAINETLSHFGASSNHTPRYEEAGSTTYDDVASFLTELASSHGFQNAFLGDLIKNFGALDKNALKLVYNLLIRPLNEPSSSQKQDRIGTLSSNAPLNPSRKVGDVAADEDDFPRRDEHIDGHRTPFPFSFPLENSKLHPPPRRPHFPGRPHPVHPMQPSSLVRSSANIGIDRDSWNPMAMHPQAAINRRGDEGIEVITAPPFNQSEVVVGFSLNPDHKEKAFLKSGKVNPHGPAESRQQMYVMAGGNGPASVHRTPPPISSLRLGLEMPPPEALDALPPGSFIIPPSQIIKKPPLPLMLDRNDGPGQHDPLKDFLPNLPFFGNGSPRPRPPPPPITPNHPPGLSSFLASFLPGLRPYRPPPRSQSPKVQIQHPPTPPFRLPFADQNLPVGTRPTGPPPIVNKIPHKNTETTGIVLSDGMGHPSSSDMVGTGTAHVLSREPVPGPVPRPSYLPSPPYDATTPNSTSSLIEEYVPEDLNHFYTGPPAQEPSSDYKEHESVPSFNEDYPYHGDRAYYDYEGNIPDYDQDQYEVYSSDYHNYHKYDGIASEQSSTEDYGNVNITQSSGDSTHFDVFYNKPYLYDDTVPHDTKPINKEDAETGDGPPPEVVSIHAGTSTSYDDRIYPHDVHLQNHDTVSLHESPGYTEYVHSESGNKDSGQMSSSSQEEEEELEVLLHNHRMVSTLITESGTTPLTVSNGHSSTEETPVSSPVHPLPIDPRITSPLDSNDYDSILSGLMSGTNFVPPVVRPVAVDSGSPLNVDGSDSTKSDSPVDPLWTATPIDPFVSHFDDQNGLYETNVYGVNELNMTDFSSIESNPNLRYDKDEAVVGTSGGHITFAVDESTDEDEVEVDSYFMAYILIGACCGLALLSVAGVIVIVRFKKTCGSQQIRTKVRLSGHGSSEDISTPAKEPEGEAGRGHKLGSWFTGRNEHFGSGKLRSNMTLPHVHELAREKSSRKLGSSRDLLSLSSDTSSRASTPHQGPQSLEAAAASTSSKEQRSQNEADEEEPRQSWLHDEYRAPANNNQGHENGNELPYIPRQYHSSSSRRDSRTPRSSRRDQARSSRYIPDSSVDSEKFEELRSQQYYVQSSFESERKDRSRMNQFMSSMDSEELAEHLGRDRYGTDSENYESRDSGSRYMGDSRELESEILQTKPPNFASETDSMADSRELEAQDFSRDLKSYPSKESSNFDATKYTDSQGAQKGEDDENSETIHRSQSQVSYSRDTIQNEVFLEFDNIFKQHQQYFTGDPPITNASTLGRESMATADTNLSNSRANSPDSIDIPVKMYSPDRRHSGRGDDPPPAPPVTPPRFSPPLPPPRPPKPGHAHHCETPPSKPSRHAHGDGLTSSGASSSHDRPVYWTGKDERLV